MLMPTKPETLKIFKEVELLEFLRDVVIPYVREREKEGKVNFNLVSHRCGTPSCLLGYAETFPALGFNPDESIFRQAERIFGLRGGEELYSIFGGASEGTLDDRAAAIDRIIERKINETVEALA